MKKFLAMLCLLVMVSTLAPGCSKNKEEDDSSEEAVIIEEEDGTILFEPEESGILVLADGGVIEYTKEEGFDEDYYSLDELEEDYVVPAVTQYNADAAGLAFAYADDTDKDLPVVVRDLTLEDGTATMTLLFASAEDYLSFYENSFTVDQEPVFSIGKVRAIDDDEDVVFVDAESGEEADLSDVLVDEKEAETNEAEEEDEETEDEEEESLLLVEINFEYSVTVQGTLLYVTDNAEVTGTDTFISCDGETVYAVFEQE